MTELGPSTKWSTFCETRSMCNRCDCCVVQCLLESLASSVVGHLSPDILDILSLLSSMVQECLVNLLMCIKGDQCLCEDAWIIHAKLLFRLTFHRKNVCTMEEYTILINEKYTEPKDGLSYYATQVILD